MLLFTNLFRNLQLILIFYNRLHIRMQTLGLKQAAEIRSKIQKFIDLPKARQTSKSHDKYMSTSQRTMKNSKISKKQSKLSPKNQPKKPWVKTPKKRIDMQSKEKSLKELSKQWKAKDSYRQEWLESQQVILKKIKQPKQQIQEQYHSRASSEAFSFNQNGPVIKQFFKVVPEIINLKKPQPKYVVQSQEETVKPSSLFGKNKDFQSNFKSMVKQTKQVKSINPVKQTKKQSDSDANTLGDGQRRLSTASLLKNMQKSTENRNKSLSLDISENKMKASKDLKKSFTNKYISKNHESSQYSSSTKGIDKNQMASSNFRFIIPSQIPQKNQKKRQCSLSAQEKKKYKTTRQPNFLINKFTSKPRSPNEKNQDLAKKYDVLDKRLSFLLEKVKAQKKAQTPSTSYLQSKPQITEQVLLYQKFSPLKKLMKVNKELRLKFEQNQKDRLFFQ